MLFLWSMPISFRAYIEEGLFSYLPTWMVLIEVEIAADEDGKMAAFK